MSEQGTPEYKRSAEEHERIYNNARLEHMWNNSDRLWAAREERYIKEGIERLQKSIQRKKPLLEYKPRQKE
jgi:hypothetical protein